MNLKKALTLTLKLTALLLLFLLTLCFLALGCTGIHYQSTGCECHKFVKEGKVFRYEGEVERDSKEYRRCL